MSDSDQPPAQLPPAASTPPLPGRAPMMPSEDPTDRDPVEGLATTVEAILRQPRRILFQVRQGNAGGLIRALLLLAAGGGLIYGLVMGTFSGGSQLWAAPLKIVLGMALSALICLPSLYIFACLSGSQAGLGHVASLLAGTLALMTILLLGFAPVVWIFSQSTESVPAMGFLHLLFWMVAVWFGMRFLLQGFTGFATRVRTGLHVWIVIFVLVTLQMSTALRPLIGTSQPFLPAEKKFFMAHWLDQLQGTPRAEKPPQE